MLRGQSKSRMYLLVESDFGPSSRSKKCGESMFEASLINDPFADPGVYLEFRYRSSAILFDLGDLHCLVPRKLLKVGHVFISHTHMDHFIGFDQLLRVFLGRERHIHLYGPPGIIQSVENKIGAYTWNLVVHYANDFTIFVTEVDANGGKLTKCYRCQKAFKPEPVEETSDSDGFLANDRFFFVEAVFLDHRTACLAFRFEEKRRINIKKTGLVEMGLLPGSWLMALKNLIMTDAPDDTPVRAWWRGEDGGLRERHVMLGELKEHAVLITPGRKVSYVTDAVFNEQNARRIVQIAAGSELLFIEATFLHEDWKKAEQKYHLTARQAGMLARQAGVKRLELFHFSPRYKGAGELLKAEAMAAFYGYETDGTVAGC